MRKVRLRITIILSILGILAYLLLIWTTTSVISFFRFQGPVYIQRERNSSGVILLWSHPWGLWDTSAPEGSTFGRCKITYNRARISEAHAVVFHLTAVSPSDIPWKYNRRRNQLYVYWSMENPWVMRYLYKRDFKRFNNFFNMTMTYRRTADIYDSYGTRRETLNKVAKGKHVVDKIMQNKNASAIWIVSNCNTMRGAFERISYVDAMVQYGFKIHRCGYCFDLCENLPLHEAAKWSEAIQKFKFYFSFENNMHCKDYITEKFWEAALWHGVVPVVYGPKDEDVIAVAPRNSYIHASWFASPEELAQYLTFLDGNNEEYRKYFAWRENEDITVEEMESQIAIEHPKVPIFSAPLLSQWHRLCDAALNINDKTWVVESLADVLLHDENPECMVPGKWENVTSLSDELEKI